MTARKATGGTASARGKRNRQKGAEFERWICSQLKPYYPQVRRNLQPQGGSAVGNDLANAGPWLIEAKWRQVCDVTATLEQAEADAQTPGYPLAIIRLGRGKPFVAMRLATLVSATSEYRDVLGTRMPLSIQAKSAIVRLEWPDFMWIVQSIERLGK